MFVDNYIPSGVAQLDAGYGGDIVDAFQGQRFDPGMMRPYIHPKTGKRVVDVHNGKWTVERGQRKPIRSTMPVINLINQGLMNPVYNSTALRKEEWDLLDREVLLAARLPMQAWSDLAAANTFGGFDGMSKMILEHETMNDPGEAVVDMDGLSEGRDDQPIFQLEGLPLPITHSDFYFSSRKLAISRNTGTPLDAVMGEAAGRRVGEMIEKTTIGVETGITYGGASTQTGGYGRTSSVYGYLNFSPRLIKNNMTAPTAGGWTPETTMTEFNAALKQLYDNKFFGPFVVYTSNDWQQYLDGDYYVAKTSGAVAPTRTLRERLKQIENIQDIRTLRFMPSSATLYAAAPERIGVANAFTLLFVQLGDKRVARAVIGLGVTTVQWPTIGGMRLNYKVMCIQVPQLRATQAGNVGILQATTA